MRAFAPARTGSPPPPFQSRNMTHNPPRSAAREAKSRTVERRESIAPSESVSSKLWRETPTWVRAGFFRRPGPAVESKRPLVMR